MITRTFLWKGLLIGLAFFGTISGLALSPSDAKAVAKALDAEAKALREEGAEMREARKVVEAAFTNPKKPDVFAFLTLVPEGGGNNYETYLFVLSDKGKGYAVIASSVVGSAIQRIETGHVEIQGQDILLRSDEIEDADNQSAYGEDKVYYRWRVDGKDLKRAGGLWLKHGTKFVEVKVR
jgi:hypothetical protein